VSNLGSLLRMPWTIGVEQGDGEFVLTVEEIPEFFAAGRTPEEAEANFWEALACHLTSYLELGQEPPHAECVGITELVPNAGVADPDPIALTRQHQSTTPRCEFVAA
jgi:predicted RNase H-like HicB family nuclease